MTQQFARDYAGLYDSLYEDKDYLHECDLLHRILRSAGTSTGAALLDLGCGTGNHLFPLANLGYKMTGVDVSPSMLAIAREKALAAGVDLDVDLREGDIRRLDLGATFDAVIMMFAVLSYQIENEDVLDALRASRRHLNAGGMLLFDVWHGPGVITIQPVTRVKASPEGAGESWVRVSSGVLDIASSTCEVEMRLFRAVEGAIEEIREHHVLRYFFRRELELMLETSGFRLERLSTFPEIDLPADENAWNVLGVARAV